MSLLFRFCLSLLDHGYGYLVDVPSRTVLLFTAVLLLTRFWVKHPRKLPPGPRGLPILGFLPFLGRDFHLKLTDLGRQYGSVYQLFLGGKRVVVVNDPALVRHAFKQPVFSGRPDTELTKLLQGYGIINSDGALWKEQRAFLHCVLREFGAKNSGSGKASLELKIQAQVEEFLETVSSFNGKPCRLRPGIARAVTNVVSSLLMSVTFSENDSKFCRLLELIEEGFRLFTLAIPVNFIPALRYVPFSNYAYLKIKRNKQETADYFQQVADEHRRTLDPSNLRDVVDAYLVQLDKANRDKDKVSYFSQKQLLQVMGDIFSAGLETVTSTIEWAILHLLRNPKVMRKVQDELDRVCGDSRLPELADLPCLPYTEATILEVLRRSNVIVLGNAHSTLDDAELGGYHIPKDTHILPNLWSIHMDPKLWFEPEKFNPERFLKDGKVSKPDCFMPFSVGRRMCVGDSLTKMEVFLFLASLLHQFDILLPPGEKLPSTDGVVAISLTPKPFLVSIVPRDKDRRL